MNRRSLSILAFIAFSTVVGCEDPAASFVADEMEAISLPAEIEIPPPPQSGLQATHLIRTGSARLEVSRLEDAIAAVQQLAVDVGGYVAGSEITEGREGARTASLLLRVPSDRFDSLFDQVSEIGHVLSASVSVTDVSRDYFDAETRLAVREETVQRLRGLLSSGGDLEDLLAAERELGRALEDLESLKGQLRYYDRRIAESDLRVSLVEPGAIVAGGAFRPVVLALRGAAEVFAQSVAYLVYLVVFVAPWTVIVLLAWPLLRRRWLRRAEQDASRAA